MAHRSRKMCRTQCRRLGEHCACRPQTHLAWGKRRLPRLADLHLALSHSLAIQSGSARNTFCRTLSILSGRAQGGMFDSRDQSCQIGRALATWSANSSCFLPSRSHSGHERAWSCRRIRTFGAPSTGESAHGGRSLDRYAAHATSAIWWTCTEAHVVSRHAHLEDITQGVVEEFIHFVRCRRLCMLHVVDGEGCEVGWG